eukprot:gene6554-3207_t
MLAPLKNLPPPSLAPFTPFTLPPCPLAVAAVQRALQNVAAVQRALQNGMMPHPRVFVYELPTHLLHQPRVSFGQIYAADNLFLSTIIGDERVRTRDPHEANLFLIPAFNSHYGGIVAWSSGAPGHMLHVIQYIKQTWPYWNRTQGRDHFYWVTNDQGTVKWSHTHPDLNAPIKVVHFGMDTKNISVEKRLRRLWVGFDKDRDVIAPPHDAPHMPMFSGNGASFLWDGFQSNGLDKFVKEKDILVFFVGSFYFGQHLTDKT